MSYKLIRTITKRETDEWFLHLNVTKSLDNTSDPRDKVLYNGNDAQYFNMYIQKLKENLPDYIGWTREYSGENVLKIKHFFNDELSARTYYERAISPTLFNLSVRLHRKQIAENQKDVQYSYLWELQDNNGNILVL